MKIISFGDYTFPLYDTEDIIPLDVRRALTILPLGDGAYDTHGDDGPLAPVRVSKRFTILPASWAAMQTALDAIRKVAGQGRQLLKIEMRDGTERQVWAKMSVRHPQRPEHHSSLPVTCDFEVAWPFWEDADDRQYFGIHAGNFGSGTFGGQHTPFSLLSVTGVLQAWAEHWLKSDTEVYQDNALTVPVVSDADPVGGWKDQSGNARHVTQATAGFKPLYKTDIVNSLPAIRLDGSDNYLIKATGLGADQLYYFLVVSPPATGTTQMMYSLNTGVIQKLGLAALTSTTGKVGFLTGTTYYDLADAAAGWQILEYLHYPAADDLIELYRNHIEIGSYAYGALLATNEILLGTDYDQVDFCAFDIAELLVVDPATSGFILQYVRSYLEARYRIDSAVSGGVATPTITYNGGARFTGGWLEIMGACTNPKLENKTNGYWLQWTGSLVAGDRLVINLSTGQAKKNGVVQDYALSKGDDQTILMALGLGDNEMEFTATSADCVAEYYWAKWYP